MEKVEGEVLGARDAQHVTVFPVRIHTNLKAETLDEFERKKKGLHIAAFKFRIEELRISLRDIALKSDRAKEYELNRQQLLSEFVESIIQKVGTVPVPPTQHSKLPTGRSSARQTRARRCPGLLERQFVSSHGFGVSASCNNGDFCNAGAIAPALPQMICSFTHFAALENKLLPWSARNTEL